MQSFGWSIKEVNIKCDPTSIGVEATKYPAEYLLLLLFSKAVTRRGLEELRN